MLHCVDHLLICLAAHASSASAGLRFLEKSGQTRQTLNLGTQIKRLFEVPTLAMEIQTPPMEDPMMLWLACLSC